MESDVDGLRLRLSLTTSDDEISFQLRATSALIGYQRGNEIVNLRLRE